MGVRRGSFCKDSKSWRGACAVFLNRSHVTGYKSSRPLVVLLLLHGISKPRNPRPPLLLFHLTADLRCTQQTPASSSALRLLLSRDSLTGDRTSPCFSHLPATGVYSGDLHSRFPSIPVHLSSSSLFSVVFLRPCKLIFAACDSRDLL